VYCELLGSGKMYQLNDTIIAVSSPTSNQRAIVRITGPQTIPLLSSMCKPSISQTKPGITCASVLICPDLRLDATIYLFIAPHSYTGEDVAEIHLQTNSSVIETLMQSLLAKNDLPVRLAEPGEFTARAYLNGKMDLTQAEAVNEVIASSNRAQLAASEKLLEGRLARTTSELHTNIVDCLSLIEAGLDFSTEDIEFITRPEAIERLTSIRRQLRELISGTITYEQIIDLPSVGIAGTTNAGKSSLLNKLLGTERSIVSSHHKTTRDILTSMLTLDHCSCVLFDCAGLIESPDNILDELTQQAAIEALGKSSLVLFCVDASKNDYHGDMTVRKLIQPRNMIAVATKTDLLSQEVLADHIQKLNNLFDAAFIPTDTKTKTGLKLLRSTIDAALSTANYSNWHPAPKQPPRTDCSKLLTSVLHLPPATKMPSPNPPSTFQPPSTN